MHTMKLKRCDSSVHVRTGCAAHVAFFCLWIELQTVLAARKQHTPVQVSEGHDGRGPRAVPRDEPMAPFDMLLCGNIPMAKVGGLVATGSFNKEHLGAERGGDGTCHPGHNAPTTGDATREAPAPQRPTERQLKLQMTPETSTGAGSGQFTGQHSATPNTSTYEASSTAQRTAAMWSSYRKQLVSCLLYTSPSPRD